MPDTEVASYVRDMQKGMQRAQAAQTVREYTPPQPGLFNFPRLPWWAWLIIAAHLIYRITKVRVRNAFEKECCCMDCFVQAAFVAAFLIYIEAGIKANTV